MEHGPCHFLTPSVTPAYSMHEFTNGMISQRLLKISVLTTKVALIFLRPSVFSGETGHCFRTLRIFMLKILSQTHTISLWQIRGQNLAHKYPDPTVTIWGNSPISWGTGSNNTADYIAWLHLALNLQTASHQEKIQQGYGKPMHQGRDFLTSCHLKLVAKAAFPNFCDFCCRIPKCRHPQLGAAAPGNLLEMQLLRLHTNLLKNLKQPDWWWLGGGVGWGGVRVTDAH